MNPLLMTLHWAQPQVLLAPCMLQALCTGGSKHSSLPPKEPCMALCTRATVRQMDSAGQSSWGGTDKGLDPPALALTLCLVCSNTWPCTAEGLNAIIKTLRGSTCCCCGARTALRPGP